MCGPYQRRNVTLTGVGNRRPIGILALQGAVEPHQDQFAKIGRDTKLVRRADDLSGIAGLVLPGGESSTMLKLLRINGLFEPLKQLANEIPLWGICAGAILLAKEVRNPDQESLALMDIAATRNAYGRQLESFIATLETTPHGDLPANLEGVFIRAPSLQPLPYESDIEVLLTYESQPVMFRQGNLLASSFHPELSPSQTIHEYFTGLLD